MGRGERTREVKERRRGSRDKSHNGKRFVCIGEKGVGARRRRIRCAYTGNSEGASASCERGNFTSRALREVMGHSGEFLLV